MSQVKSKAVQQCPDPAVHRDPSSVVNCVCIHCVTAAESQKPAGRSGFGASLLPKECARGGAGWSHAKCSQWEFSLQSSYFPGAVPASHLHLYLPTNVKTLNGVLHLSNRLEMQICWHKNCPISPNTVL